MDKPHPVLERVARGQTALLDGGVACELHARGFAASGPIGDAAAAREAPGLLLATHKAFVDAGADILTAFTARTTVRVLSRGGVGMRAASLTHRAVDLALEAAQQAGRAVAVAGSLGTLEDIAHPEHHVSPHVLAEEHSEQARRLESTGCDLILVEPMPTLIESLAATAAARGAFPTVWTVLALRDAATTASGEALARAAASVIAVGAQAILVESADADDLVAASDALALANLGVVIGVRFAAAPRSDRDQFARQLAQALQRNARIAGGSEHATPEHIRALAERIHGRAAA